MLAALGINISTTFIKYAVVAVVMVGVCALVFAGYRHVENNRSALIAQAQTSAAASVEAKVSQSSADFIKEQAAKMAKDIEAKDQAESAEQGAWDKTFAQIDALPLDVTPPADRVDPDQAEDKADIEASTPAAPPASPSKPKKKANVQRQDPAASVRALDAQLDGMLERSSGATD